jgi:glycosyltransferase involved in cell wall biosynthesis
MLESPAVPLCLVPAVVSSRQVIVPSNANAISISASMPAASVQVCGYGFSPAEFVRRFDTPYESSTVVFGSVFDWKSSSGDRKNIRAMVRAFESAFMPDRYKNKVKLVLCCAEIPDFLSCNSNPQIEVLPGWKSRDSIVQTIASFDCGVYVPAYEGYGIAALETLASGKPLITHSLSGHSEFVPVSDSFIVKCSTTKARGAYQGLGFWYEPDSASYIEAFRTAFNLGKTLPSIRGVAAGKKISSLTWANSFNRLIELVKP